MAINKAQGQTIEKVGIYLLYPVFCHGQLYVAFSRVRTMAAVKVKVLETNQQGIRGRNTDTKHYIKMYYSHLKSQTD